jgi:hemoglobin/transferrin/lactoferrin receptor protein
MSVSRNVRALLLGVSAIALMKSAFVLGAGAQSGQPATTETQTASDVTLEPVTVVPTRRPERVSQSLSAVSTARSAPVQPAQTGPVTAAPSLSSNTLQQFMPTRSQDVFFGMPGVTTQTRGDDPGTAVNIRGLQDFGRVAVLIDGARQNFQRTGHNADGVFYLEPEMLAAVDVVRGPVANIYGSGAIGGVVAFRTKDVEDVVKTGQRWGVVATGMLGANTFKEMGSVFAGAKINQYLDVFAGGVLRRNGNYKDGNGMEWPNTAFDVASGIAKATVRPAKGHEIKFTGITYETDFRNGQPNATQTATVYDTTVKNKVAATRYRYSRPDDRIFDFDGNVYWTQTVTDQTKIQGTSSAAGGILGSSRSFAIDTTGYDLNNTSRLDTPVLRNAFTYGSDYFQDKVNVVDPSGTGDLFTPNGVRTVQGSFVQWRAQHSTWFEAITAVRYDKYELDGGAFHSDGDRVSPKATIGITPVRGFTVYGTYAEGYRAPAVTETLIAGLHPPTGGPPFAFVPNPQLRPEVGFNKEIGINLYYDNILMRGDAFRAKANYFKNDLANFIEFVLVPPCQPGTAFCFQYQNLPSARIEGYEFEGTYDTGWWFVGLAGSHIRGRNLDTGVPLLKIMPDQLLATVGARFLDRKVTVAVRWLAVDAKRREEIPNSAAITGNPDLPPTEAYSLVNLHVGYQPHEDVTAALTVDNLFDKFYAQYLNAYASGQSILPFPSPGRTIKGTLTVRFGGGQDPSKVAMVTKAPKSYK